MLLHGQRAQVKPQFQPGKERFLHFRGIAFHRVLHPIQLLFQVQGTVAELLCLDVVDTVFPAHDGVRLFDAVDPFFPLRNFVQIRHASLPRI